MRVTGNSKLWWWGGEGWSQKPKDNKTGQQSLDGERLNPSVVRRGGGGGGVGGGVWIFSGITEQYLLNKCTFLAFISIITCILDWGGGYSGLYTGVCATKSTVHVYGLLALFVNLTILVCMSEKVYWKITYSGLRLGQGFVNWATQPLTPPPPPG